MRIALIFLVLTTLLLALGRGPVVAEDIQVFPPVVALDRPEASQQLLVTGKSPDGRLVDWTHAASFEVADPAIAEVSTSGRIEPRTDGKTEILVVHGDKTQKVAVLVSGLADPEKVSFRHDLVPILTKAGCNSGGCHGKAEGQNGFKLSVFGFDPQADHDALIKQGRGRRVSVMAPGHSLFLLKGSGGVPHGGGVKFPQQGRWFRLVERWIQEGALLTDDDSRAVQQITVEPREIVMAKGETQQLLVTAIDQGGRRQCVTAEAEFRTNADAIAGVDSDGLIRVTGIPGEAAMLIRYQGRVAVCRVTLPQANEHFARPSENNFVDRLVWDKLQHLGIGPSELADDATFMRRAYLDTIGTLPAVAEAKQFLDDQEPGKRSRLIDQLLERDEYADYWAMRWANILRVDKLKITPQGSVAMTRWLRGQFASNTRYDEFVRQIVTARGDTLTEGPAAFYQANDKPEMMGRSISQLFLGVRIECAQCHHHPFEKWSQADYFAFAGFFSGVARKKLPTGGQKIYAKPGTDLKHPRTNEPVATAGLGAEPASFDRYLDRREALADWMASGENSFFARSIANRLWSHYFGRGLVEPIDDMRATNPATNEPLLDALADHLVESDFDLKALTRTLLNSRVYQLSAIPNDSNALDEQHFSHATWKALPAEVLLDAICQATNVPEQFNGWPLGYRAIQVWDNGMPSYFFRIFGRPARVTVCECERGNEPSIAQALHLMNSSEATAKIRHRDGRARLLTDSNKSTDEIIEELYLATVSRRPKEAEYELMRAAFADAQAGRGIATEDVLWTLLNMKEFVYNH